jgi:outer membrane protein assembly factor BamD (BamD/ComL family)
MAGMMEKLTYVADVALSLVALGTVLWLFVRAFKNSDNRPVLILKWIVTFLLFTVVFGFAVWLGPVGPFVIVFIGLVFSILWTPAIGEWVSKPLTSFYDGGFEPQEAKPLYSTALAKRMRGKYLEATLAIREQLAQFPNDYEGISLLARIQAEDMKDLASAELTINNFCADPQAPPKQFAAALTQLADWHLQVAQDTHSAREALEKIIAQFPDSDLALAAAQRIAHLEGAEKLILAKHDRQAIAVPEGVQNIGLLESTQFLQPAEENPAQQAARYVRHLADHPQDTDVREKLAVIYADHYQRLDLAVGELAQMINTPNQPPKRVAHWLTLLANLQIRHGADYDTIRQTLEKIVTAYPDLPVAQSAQARINHLKLELKGLEEKTPDKKLGVYEQNIGLKYGPPSRG